MSTILFFFCFRNGARCSAPPDSKPQAHKAQDRKGGEWEHSVAFDLDCWTRTWRRLRAVAGWRLRIRCRGWQSLQGETETPSRNEVKCVYGEGRFKEERCMLSTTTRSVPLRSAPREAGEGCQSGSDQPTPSPRLRPMHGNSVLSLARLLSPIQHAHLHR